MGNTTENQEGAEAQQDDVPRDTQFNNQNIESPSAHENPQNQVNEVNQVSQSNQQYEIVQGGEQYINDQNNIQYQVQQTSEAIQPNQGRVEYQISQGNQAYIDNQGQINQENLEYQQNQIYLNNQAYGEQGYEVNQGYEEIQQNQEYEGQGVVEGEEVIEGVEEVVEGDEEVVEGEEVADGEEVVEGEEIIGRITVGIGSWLQLPAFLQNLQNLPLLNLNMRVQQECMNIIGTETVLCQVVPFHHIQTKFHHIQFGTWSVVANDVVKSIRMDKRRIEPHSAFFFR